MLCCYITRHHIYENSRIHKFNTNHANKTADYKYCNNKLLHACDVAKSYQWSVALTQKYMF